MGTAPKTPAKPAATKPVQKPKSPVFMAFFGGAGDGPGLFHSAIVKDEAKYGFEDPSKIGLGEYEIDKESKYLEWSDAAFGRDKAKNTLAYLESQCLAYPVVFVCHSYGCEAALHTIKKMKDTHVTHLITLDGVSWMSKLRNENRPANVAEWTNVYVSGFSDLSDVIAVVGGHWGERDGATRNLEARSEEGFSHGGFKRLWRKALPFVRTSLTGGTGK
jgi:hypothetical protein